MEPKVDKPVEDTDKVVRSPVKRVKKADPELPVAETPVAPEKVEAPVTPEKEETPAIPAEAELPVVSEKAETPVAPVQTEIPVPKPAAKPKKTADAKSKVTKEGTINKDVRLERDYYPDDVEIDDKGQLGLF
ncbi:hypothetical protein [Pedobacter sp. NJ-S-72]